MKKIGLNIVMQSLNVTVKKLQIKFIKNVMETSSKIPIFYLTSGLSQMTPNLTNLSSNKGQMRFLFLEKSKTLSTRRWGIAMCH